MNALWRMSGQGLCEEGRWIQCNPTNLLPTSGKANNFV